MCRVCRVKGFWPEVVLLCLIKGTLGRKPVTLHDPTMEAFYAYLSQQHG